MESIKFLKSSLKLQLALVLLTISISLSGQISNNNYAITSIDYSADNKFILTEGMDRAIRIWNSETGQLINIFDLFEENTNTARFANGDKTIISYGFNKIFIRDFRTGKLVRSLKYLENSKVLISGDGNKLCFLNDQKITLYDFKSDSLVKELNVNTLPDYSPDYSEILDISQNGEQIIVKGLEDSYLVTLNSEAQKLGNSKYKFDPNGKPIISALEKLLHKLEKNFKAKKSNVFVIPTNDGNHIYTVNESKLTIWTNSEKSFKEVPTGINSEISHVSVSPNNQYLITTENNRAINFWNFNTMAKIRTYNNHLYAPSVIQISKSSKYVAFGFPDGSLVLITLDNYNTPIEMTGHSEESLWLGKFNPRLVIPFSHSTRVSALYNPWDGKYLVSIDIYRNIFLWDIKSKNLLRTFHLSSVKSGEMFGLQNEINIQIDSTSRWLSATKNEEEEYTWEIATGKSVPKIERIENTTADYACVYNKKGKVYSINKKQVGAKFYKWNSITKVKMDSLQVLNSDHIISPSGKYLAAYLNNDSTVSVIDLDSFETVRTHTPLWSINNFTFNKNDSYAYFTNSGNQEIGWTTRAQFFDLIGMKSQNIPGQVSSIAFESDSTIIVGNDEGTIRIWNLKDHKPLNSLGTIRPSNLASHLEKPYLLGNEYFRSFEWETNKTLSSFNFQNAYWVKYPDQLQIFDSLGLRIYQGPDYRLLFKLNDVRYPNDYRKYKTKRVWCNSISPDLKYTVVYSDSKQIEIWNIPQNRLIYSYPYNFEIRHPFSDVSGVFRGDVYEDIKSNIFINLISGTPILKKQDIDQVVRKSNALSTNKGQTENRPLIWTESYIVEKHEDNEDPNENYFIIYKNKYPREEVFRSGFSEYFTDFIEIKNGYYFGMLINGINKPQNKDDGTELIIDLSTGKGIFLAEGQIIYIDKKSGNAIIQKQDGFIYMYNLLTGENLLKFFQLDEDNSIVIHPSGLFDITPGVADKLYFVQGDDKIEFSQLKERYYEPGLWKKVLDGDQLRNVVGMKSIDLPPDIQVGQVDDKGYLNIQLTNRGGGIGEVNLFVNGKEVIKDARDVSIKPDALTATLKLFVGKHKSIVKGQENFIAVKAWNKDHWVQSRGVVVSYQSKEIESYKPAVHILTCGVSDYSGNEIDLKYAAKDANDMSTALQLGAEKLFGAERSYVYNLTTTQAKEFYPTKANILKVIEKISSTAHPLDIFVMYVSGHGINYGGQDGDWHYLTQEAYTGSGAAYNDPSIRAQTTISSNELVELFKKVPALKQVLMLDACASGKVVDNLIAQKDIESSTLRALDRMRDRTGMHIITGCTADAVSYEASKYGQGVLTYSLLEGIRGAALRDDQYVDVNKLFQYAQDRVPQLAEGIGGIQSPQVFSPQGSQSFDIGLLSDNEKKEIPIAKIRPVFVRSNFQDENELEDVLGLSKQMDEALNEVSSKGVESILIFVDVREYPEGCKLSGLYKQESEKILLKLRKRCGTEDKTFDLKSDSLEGIKKEIWKTL